MWCRWSGGPLYPWKLSPGVRPEIWFQCCFYKEPIGTKSLAGAAGAARKAREKQAPARARPERFYDTCDFLLKHHWLLVLVKSVKTARPGQKPYYVGFYAKVAFFTFVSFFVFSGRVLETTVGVVSGGHRDFANPGQSLCFSTFWDLRIEWFCMLLSCRPAFAKTCKHCL